MTAKISECGKYRYLLTRPATAQSERGTALFVMLNPSTADSDVDDPTIRRCRGFAEQWGCNGIVVANLYAYRATNPKELKKPDDPIGPENDRHLHKLALEFEDVVFAWGSNAPADRAAQVADIFQRYGRRIWCLGATKAGAPRHPLYIPYSQSLIPWPVEE